MGLFSIQYNLIHHCVERLAVIALHSEKMPSSVQFLLLAIVASNVDNSAKVRRHGLQCDSSCHGVPCWKHSFPCLCRLFAHRTATIMSRELTKAIPVNSMAAWHFVRGTSGTKEIFLTDGAVAAIFASFAIVVIVQTLVNTHAAFVAMLEVVGPADAAESTVCTMIRSFLIRHPKVANVAMIGSKA